MDSKFKSYRDNTFGVLIVILLFFVFGILGFRLGGAL